MGDFLLGCDIGTSSTKSAVIDLEGKVLGSHSRAYPLIQTKGSEDTFPGIKAEHRPDQDYWEAVAETMRVSVAQARIDPAEIRGISISALSPACILVDKKGRSLQNAHIWMDRRATAECEWIREHIGDERVFKTSANPIDPYYATAKLLWEKRNRPKLYKETYKLQTAADYPVLKLTGKAVTDYSNASLIGIAFDIQNKRWDAALLEELELDPDKFPDPYPCDQVIGEVTREAAEKCGLRQGIPVVAGTVDCNAAWVAGGAVDDGDVSLVMGTAGVLGIVHSEPKFTRNMITIVHTAYSREKYTTLAALVCCGELMRYFRNNFAHLEVAAAEMLGRDVMALLNDEASRAPAGSGGLIVVPYLGGERTPIWDSLARGIVFGLALDHGREHFIRAMMEGAAYALRHNFELMREDGVTMRFPIVLSEGGAHSKLWRQIVCDVLDVEGVFMKESKGAPVGNAVAAGVGVGLFKDYHVVKQWTEVADRTVPDGKRHELYTALYKVFQELYPRSKDLFAQVADAVTAS